MIFQSQVPTTFVVQIDQSVRCQGRIHGGRGARAAIATLPLRYTAAGQKLETPSRSKSNSFLGRVAPDLCRWGGDTPSHTPPPRRLDLRAYGAQLHLRLRRRLWRLDPWRLHSPPSHTFWIRPCPVCVCVCV